MTWGQVGRAAIVRLAGSFMLMTAVSQVSVADALAPVLIGLDADMSAGAAMGGEAIRRGAVIAIDEINRSGGVLGRPMKLVVRDHRGNPDRGIDNMREFAAMADMVAVVGGVHTPVALAELEIVHEQGLIYLGPWAAGTSVVENGYEPNFVFRVSARDRDAGELLIEAAFARGLRSPALLLWQTAWGRSNEQALTAALERRHAKPATVQWYNTGVETVADQLTAIARAGADSVILIAEPGGALAAVGNMAALPADERLPIIAHWGVTAGRLHELGQQHFSTVDLTFLQTFSFFDPPFPERAASLLDIYCERFHLCDRPGRLFAPTGTAHAYDLVHLLARAIEQAGTLDRTLVRDALENLDSHEGLMRNYDPPFAPDRHDALDYRDLRLATYDENGAIVPLSGR